MNDQAGVVETMNTKGRTVQVRSIEKAIRYCSIHWYSIVLVQVQAHVDR